jgi:hypothetical protein
VACLCVLAGVASSATAPARAATVGHGTAASCTSARVVAAVRGGGTIRFACGPRPVTIRMRATARVRNTSRAVVLDGGGRVTLSGQGRRRILYLNTCDRSLVFTTSHCQDQATPRLTVRGIAFANGNATGEQIDGAGAGRSSPGAGGCASSARRSRQPMRPPGPRRRRRGGPRAVPVPRPAGRRVRQPLRAQRLQQRRGAQQHRRVVDRPPQRLVRQPRDRPRGEPGPRRHARRAAAARSTTTATASG